MFCCEDCEEISWSLHHSFLCTGSITSATGPSMSRDTDLDFATTPGGEDMSQEARDVEALKAFYDHASSSNEIFVLAAKVGSCQKNF